MKVVKLENTPNPNALKLLLDGKILETGSRSYDHPSEAKGDPVATALFEIPDVKSVFFMPTFVTIVKEPAASWDGLAQQVSMVLETQSPLESGSSTTSAESGESQDERFQQIRDVISTRIAPALAMDGGGLEVLGLDGHVLTIRYQGACGSCPSAAAGTLRGIEHLLRVEVDPALTVIPG
jgi:Fe-S cluster biogenesis protein NfuA